MVNNEVSSSKQNHVELEFRREKHKEEMKYQVISFLLMICFTIAAFIAVAAEGFHSLFVIPIIIILACVQVGFQLYYFMHMSQKGHGVPALFLYGGVAVAVVTLFAFATIIWW